jgi:hypothetical protein
MMVTKGEGGSPARVRLPEKFAPLDVRCQPNIGALIKYMCGDEKALVRLKPAKKEEAAKTPAAATT